jgi:hypothetical protein
MKHFYRQLVVTLHLVAMCSALHIRPGTRWQQSDPVTLVSAEQYYITEFLLNWKVKPAENLHRLSVQYAEENLSCASIWDWYKKFSEGCM